MFPVKNTGDTRKSASRFLDFCLRISPNL